jgi:hypothetical protein
VSNLFFPVVAPYLHPTLSTGETRFFTQYCHAINTEETYQRTQNENNILLQKKCKKMAILGKLN